MLYSYWHFDQRLLLLELFEFLDFLAEFLRFLTINLFFCLAAFKKLKTFSTTSGVEIKGSSCCGSYAAYAGTYGGIYAGAIGAGAIGAGASGAAFLPLTKRVKNEISLQPQTKRPVSEPKIVAMAPIIHQMAVISVALPSPLWFNAR